MPDHTIDLLFRFLHQNAGHLSRRAREAEFAKMTDKEVSAAEAAYLANFPTPTPQSGIAPTVAR